MEKTAIEMLGERLTEEQRNLFIQTLKEISENTAAKNGQKRFLTESSLKAINFDKVKDVYTQHVLMKEGVSLYRTPCSNDALYFDKNTWYFIEFKAGRNIEVSELYEKIYDSLMIMWDLEDLEEKIPLYSVLKQVGFHNQLSFFRENVHYILVYNSEYQFEENEYDKKGFLAKLNNHEYDDMIRILEDNKVYLNFSSDGRTYLKSEIGKGHFRELTEIVSMIRRIEDGEYVECINYLDDYPEDLEKILEQNRKLKKYFDNNQKLNGKSGYDILKYILMAPGCNNSTFIKLIKKLKQLRYLHKLEMGDYNALMERCKNEHLIPMREFSNIPAYIKSLIENSQFEAFLKGVADGYDAILTDALVENTGMPKQYFFLFQFENYLFKKVETLSDIEFKRKLAGMQNEI